MVERRKQSRVRDSWNSRAGMDARFLLQQDCQTKAWQEDDIRAEMGKWAVTHGDIKGKSIPGIGTGLEARMVLMSYTVRKRVI